MLNSSLASTEYISRCAQMCARCAAHGVCALEKLSPESRTSVRLHLREHAFKDEETLYTQGDSTQRLLVVKSGAVLVSYRSDQGESTAVALLGPGTALGKLTPFTAYPHLFTATAVGATRICSLPTHALRHAAPLHRELTPALCDSFLRFQRDMAAWSVIVRIPVLQDQLIACLQQLGRMQASTELRLPPHKVLAALLGTTRESVSRTLTRMGQQGFFEKMGRQRIRWQGAAAAM